MRQFAAAMKFAMKFADLNIVKSTLFLHKMTKKVQKLDENHPTDVTGEFSTFLKYDNEYSLLKVKTLLNLKGK